MTHIPIRLENLLGRILANDLVDPATGEVLGNGNQPLTEELLVKMKQKGMTEVECLVLDAPGVSSTHSGHHAPGQD